MGNNILIYRSTDCGLVCHWGLWWAFFSCKQVGRNDSCAVYVFNMYVEKPRDSCVSWGFFWWDFWVGFLLGFFLVLVSLHDTVKYLILLCIFASLSWWYLFYKSSSVPGFALVMNEGDTSKVRTSFILISVNKPSCSIVLSRCVLCTQSEWTFWQVLHSAWWT